MENMIRTKFQQPLKQFLESSTHFEVVHSITGSSPSNFKRVLILDSSFNPPHLGHYSIIKKALDHPGFESSVVLLLLSVKNADKLIPKPAAFEDRLNMMCLLSDSIAKELNVDVHVGLTKHAKFVDKSNSIRNHFAADKIYTFLLGFDTLIRIFDGKYYKPLTIKESLDEFMSKNELFCLTRLDDKNYNIEEQLRFFDDIQSGLSEPEIPQSWSKSIFMVHGDSETLKISSSDIRNKIEGNTETNWKSSVIEEVADYVTTYKPYSTDSKT